jgi:23S rRNA (uracil1939-C5)-methyltransferase
MHAEYKRQWLCEAMHGLIDPALIDVTPAKIAWAWRRTITLHARWESDRWICGFVARDNASLVAVSCCPIFFHDGEERILNELRRCVLLLPGVPSAALDFKLFRLSEGRFALTIQGKLSCNDEIRQRFVHSLSRIASLDSVCWKTSSDRTYTPFEGSFELWGRRWHFSVDAFLQNHLEQSAIVWGDCLDIVHKAGPQQNILDLYSGIGVTAISLALRGHRVTAVEWSNAAVRMAQRTAHEIAWETASPPRFVCGSVEDFLPSAPREDAWWIVNPPRTGLSDAVVSQIIKKRPERIVYISCSAPTMARDVKKLVKDDWVVNHVHGYDMFPQTTHFETLVVLLRSKIS